jgi:hypothetical protein
MYPFMSYPWYVSMVNIGPWANFFRYSFVSVSDDWEIWSWNQLMNFLMCSFTNHDSLYPWLSLSNTSLCSSKYSDTMDICCNTWKWAQQNKYGHRVITFFPMVPFPMSLPTWRDLWTSIGLLGSAYFRAHSTASFCDVPPLNKDD